MLNAQFVSLNCAILKVFSSVLSVYICVLNLLLPCEMQPHMPRIIHRVKLNGASTFQCDGFSSLNHSHTIVLSLADSVFTLHFKTFKAH